MERTRISGQLRPRMLVMRCDLSFCEQTYFTAAFYQARFGAGVIDARPGFSTILFVRHVALTAASTAGSADKMPHFFLLGLQITFKGRFAGDCGRDSLDDGDPGSLNGGYFFGIVGHQTDGRHSQMFQDFGG